MFVFVAGGIISAYISAYLIYNLYLHPLANFPGPFWARACLLWRIRHSMGGRFHRSIENAHRKYGVVFRVSPNELSFSSVRSWKDVYGPRPDQACFPKSDFYDIFGAGFKSGCIGSERDPVRHSQMKRLLAPAFSRKALAE
ncbi:hypothetical protein XANCAGTX0491_007889 [Xanthoria calcicola]